MFCGRTFIFKWLKKHFCCSTHASQSEGGRHGKSRENQNLIPSYPDPAAQKHSNTNTVHHFAHDRKKEGEPPAWVVMNHLDCKFVHISLYEGDRCFSEWKGFVENQHFCREAYGSSEVVAQCGPRDLVPPSRSMIRCELVGDNRKWHNGFRFDGRRQKK